MSKEVIADKILGDRYADYHYNNKRYKEEKDRMMWAMELYTQSKLKEVEDSLMNYEKMIKALKKKGWALSDDGYLFDIIKDVLIIQKERTKKAIG